MAERQIDSHVIVFTDNLDDKIEYIFSKFMDHNKQMESQTQKEEPPYSETSTCWKPKPTRVACELIKKPHILNPEWNRSNSWGLTGWCTDLLKRTREPTWQSTPEWAACPGSNEEKPLNFELTLNAYHSKWLKHQFGD